MRLRNFVNAVLTFLCVVGCLRASADKNLYILGVSLDQQEGVAGGWTRVGKQGDWKNTLAGAVLNDRLYTTETSGALYETELPSGNWKQIGKQDFALTAFLFAANSTLYEIETSGSLYRISATDGSRDAIGQAGAWKNTVAGTVLDNRLYTVESNGELYVTDLSNGAWQQIGKPEFGDTVSLLSANNTLYSFQRDGGLSSVNVGDGSRTVVGVGQAWKRAISRVGFHNQVVTAESDGALVVSNLTTGARTPLGRHEFGNTQHMFATTDGLYTIETDGSMYRVFLKPGGGIDAYDWCPAEIEKVFREQGGRLYGQIKSRQVNGAGATRAGILDGFRWLQQNATDDDLVVIYVGCHGDTNPEQGWGIVTAEGKMVWGNELKTGLGKLPCQVIMMVETCTSGGFALPHKNDPPLPPNVTALCACTAAQTTDNQLDIALAEGLYGRADFNHDGVVSVDELVRYIPQRYLEWWPDPKGSDGSQTPVIVKSPGLSGALPLTAVSPALAAVDVEGKLWSALLEGQDGAGYKVHLLGWSSQPGKPYFLTNKVSRDAICLPGEGAPLLVENGGKWLPARMVSQAEGKFKVRYLGSGQEELVGSERVRYPFVSRR